MLIFPALLDPKTSSVKASLTAEKACSRPTRRQSANFSLGEYRIALACLALCIYLHTPKPMIGAPALNPCVEPTLTLPLTSQCPRSDSSASRCRCRSFPHPSPSRRFFRCQGKPTSTLLSVLAITMLTLDLDTSTLSTTNPLNAIKHPQQWSVSPLIDTF